MQHFGGQLRLDFSQEDGFENNNFVCMSKMDCKLNPEPNSELVDRWKAITISFVCSVLTVRTICIQLRQTAISHKNFKNRKNKLGICKIKCFHITFKSDVYYRIYIFAGTKKCLKKQHKQIHFPQCIGHHRKAFWDRDEDVFSRESIWPCNEICLLTLTKFGFEKVFVRRFVEKSTILVSLCVRLENETIWQRRVHVVVFNVMAAAKSTTPCHGLPGHFVVIPFVNAYCKMCCYKWQQV